MIAKNSLALLILAMASVAGAQWNIDLDIMSGSVGVGNGAPSSAFGGAAGQVGYWNRTDAIPSDPEPIANIYGQHLGATIQVNQGGGSWGGFNNPNLSGDFALLMKDAAQVTDPAGNVYWFNGLGSGYYDVYTYAAKPSGEILPVPVTILGSLTQNPQVVSGPLTGNQFQQGITHSVHRLWSPDGSISVHVGYAFGGMVNGFQIVPVPEPGTIALCIGFLGFALERRGSARNRKMR